MEPMSLLSVQLKPENLFPGETMWIFNWLHQNNPLDQLIIYDNQRNRQINQNRCWGALTKREKVLKGVLGTIKHKTQCSD